MGKFKPSQSDSFTLEGQFLGYIPDSEGKLKFLRLIGVGDRPVEQVIKLSKDLRTCLTRLTPGQHIQVMGTRKWDEKTERTKLKAEWIKIVPAISLLPTLPSKPETILVCQKSDCCKLGGKAIATALETALAEKGLTHQVTVKATGCMKRCKAGPNLIMPDKTRYTQIRPEAIPALVDQYFDPAAVQKVS